MITQDIDMTIAEKIAKEIIAERKAKLDARVNQIAAEKGMSVVERAKFRARAYDAMDRGDLRF